MADVAVRHGALDIQEIQNGLPSRAGEGCFPPLNQLRECRHDTLILKYSLHNTNVVHSRLYTCDRCFPIPKTIAHSGVSAVFLNASV